MYPVNFPTNPKFLWQRFFELSQLPRPSHKEQRVQEYLEKLATDKGLELKKDKAGNIVIYVPGTSGRESEQAVIIQNHIDMVCDHAPGVEINFEKDPIELIVEENKVTANGTTLGADNGIGCAAALAVLDENVSHPPLELLFTVEEETGLFGAANLDSSLLSGKKMINLDTEEFGSFYIGCAGGLDFDLERPVQMDEKDAYYVDLQISGLIGGHSGIDIHRGRGNAIKILNECLIELNLRGLSFNIAEMKAGKAKNIIPRDSSAVIGVLESDVDKLEKVLSEKFEDFLTRFPTEENLKLDIEHFGVQNRKVLDEQWSSKLMELLLHLPHGAYDYIWESKEPLAKYSSNLAVVLLGNGELHILSSMRFTEESDIHGLTQEVRLLSKKYNMKLSERGGYPGWKPDFDSKMLEQAVELFEQKFNFRPEVTAIHAGLECGILKSKLGEVDCISFGPNIRGAHSPDEYVEIDSVEKFWTFFVDYLAKVAG